MVRDALSRRAFACAAAIALMPRPREVARAKQAAADDRLLLDVVFAPADLPGGETQAIYYRLDVPPGVVLTQPVGPYCGCAGEGLAQGVGVEYVTGGRYTLRLDAPLLVRRADGGEEAVDAGSDVVLGPGEAAVFGDYATVGELTAGGDEPVTLVGVAIVAIADTGAPAPDVPVGARGVQLAQISPMTWANAIGSAAAEVSLRRVELPAGGALAPYAPAGMEAMLVETGEIDVNTLRPSEKTPAHRPFSYAAGRAMPFLVLAPENRRTLANPGDEPAVLLVVSIAAEGTGSATPVAPAAG